MGFVLNKLAGQPLRTLPGGRAAVPLLHPQQHGLPFALTLELQSCPAEAAAPAQSRAAAAPAAAAPDRSLYALHYVLAGSGQLVRPGGSDALQAGDAVLMHSGAAACCAAPGEAGSGLSSGDTAGTEAGPWQLAQLVAYMPRGLFEQQQDQQQQQQQRQQHCDVLMHSASLQPLLQSDSSSSSSSSMAGVSEQLTESFVAELLAGAKDTARQALLGAAEPSTQQQPEVQQPASSSNGGSSSGWVPLPPLPPMVQAAVSSLAAWWQQQQQRTCPVTKRTLSELTAFRLPNQSNRLAIQFDPLSRPQVPFISGIEVFERGHRTRPHVHPHAHELFFILAGQGTGFCGDQRFPVQAGDVVVFRPGAVHGIDNSDDSRMYCLELMLPNEQFAEYVRAGTDTGRLADDDMCVLASIGCA